MRAKLEVSPEILQRPKKLQENLRNPSPPPKSEVSSRTNSAKTEEEEMHDTESADELVEPMDMKVPDLDSYEEFPELKQPTSVSSSMSMEDIESLNEMYERFVGNESPLPISEAEARSLEEIALQAETIATENSSTEEKKQELITTTSQDKSKEILQPKNEEVSDPELKAELSKGRKLGDVLASRRPSDQPRSPKTRRAKKPKPIIAAYKSF